MAFDLAPAQRPLAVFRCDASAQMGFGHATRCLAVADALSSGDADAWRTVFAMASDADGAAFIRSRGYEVQLNPAAEGDANSEAAWLAALVAHEAAAVVFDVRTQLPATTVHDVRARGITTVVLDDGTDRRIEADLAFYPPVPQLESLDWQGFTGQRFAGFEWIPLRSDVATERETIPRRGAGTPTVVVSMGGSDPAGITLRALAALELVRTELRVVIAIGPSFLHRDLLNKQLAGASRRYELLADQSRFLRGVAAADLAIASFGVTAYELAALGVPAIHLCLTADHAASATSLERIGASINLGVYERVTPEALARQVEGLLSDAATLTRMSERGRTAIDGRGAARIAAVIRQHAGRPSVLSH